MSTFTKEQLIEKLQHRISVASRFPESEKAQMDLELARIALASLEAEPVAWLLSGGGAKNNVSFDSGNAYADPLREVTPLYASPPAPVSVPAAMEIDDDFDSAFEHGKAVGWNAYRAAMLQGSQPVSQTYKFPVNTPCQDAPAHIWLQTAGVWPENGELSELTWCSHNQHHDDTLYVRADLVNGNSPVTPDGWISCSERMPVIGELNWRTSFPLLITCEIGVIPAYYGFVSVNGDRHYGFMESLKYGDDSGGHPQTNEYGLISNVTHWMSLPEPPQEVKP
ncbi:DUF551 domain-containing protein [Escherichia coli]|nr:DUF551 domain-containing protein [Escherichia coli]